MPAGTMAPALQEIVLDVDFRCTQITHEITGLFTHACIDVSSSYFELRSGHGAIVEPMPNTAHAAACMRACVPVCIRIHGSATRSGHTKPTTCALALHLHSARRAGLVLPSGICPWPCCCSRTPAPPPRRDCAGPCRGSAVNSNTRAMARCLCPLRFVPRAASTAARGKCQLRPIANSGPKTQNRRRPSLEAREQAASGEHDSGSGWPVEGLQREI